jgi:hypothetical protein
MHNGYAKIMRIAQPSAALAPRLLPRVQFIFTLVSQIGWLTTKKGCPLKDVSTQAKVSAIVAPQ